MPKVIIKDVPGLDGEYPLDLVFTHRDFHTIKKVSGIRANEVMEALEAGDLDIIVAVCEIALQRAGVEHNVDELWDTAAGSIVLDVSDVEADAGPPPVESDSEPRSDEDKPSSGNGTSSDTAAFQETLNPDSSGIPRPVST